jgi:hypothetical protein
VAAVIRSAYRPCHWVAAQLLAAAAPLVRLREPCSSTPTPAPPMPTPADPLAQLLAAVLAYRPQPRAWPRPRPAYLPHPRRRLPRVRGVVWVRSKA